MNVRYSKIRIFWFTIKLFKPTIIINFVFNTKFNNYFCDKFIDNFEMWSFCLHKVSSVTASVKKPGYKVINAQVGNLAYAPSCEQI